MHQATAIQRAYPSRPEWFALAAQRPSEQRPKGGDVAAPEQEPMTEETLELTLNQPDTIVLATDLSEESRRAFVPTAVLARELGMQLILLHVVHDIYPVPIGSPLVVPIQVPGVNSEVRQARDELDELARYLGGEVQSAVIQGTDIVESIAGFADRVDASFIAISTHGRTGFRRLVLGSVAEGLMRRSKIPIVCYPRS